MATGNTYAIPTWSEVTGYTYSNFPITKKSTKEYKLIQGNSYLFVTFSGAFIENFDKVGSYYVSTTSGTHTDMKHKISYELSTDIPGGQYVYQTTTPINDDYGLAILIMACRVAQNNRIPLDYAYGMVSLKATGSISYSGTTLTISGAIITLRIEVQTGEPHMLLNMPLRLNLLT